MSLFNNYRSVFDYTSVVYWYLLYFAYRIVISAVIRSTAVSMLVLSLPSRGMKYPAIIVP